MKRLPHISLVLLIVTGACNSIERHELTTKKETASGVISQSETSTRAVNNPLETNPSFEENITLPTGPSTAPTITPTPPVEANSCTLSISSPASGDLAYDESFSGSFVTNGVGGAIGKPTIVFDSVFAMPIRSSGFQTWSFEFNPFLVNTRLEVGVPTSKEVKATYLDAKAVERECKVSINLLPPSNETDGDDSEACRFLSASTLQPLLPKIKVTTSGSTDFNWSQVFALETSDTTKKPSIKFTFDIAPFTYTPPSNKIVLRDDGAGWNVNVIGRNTVFTKIEVDLETADKSCSLTADPSLP